VVAEKTFEWGSFRLFGKVPKSDLFVAVLVTVTTVITDLAIAVILGVIVAALIFAWEHAKQISVNAFVDEKGWKIYELQGSLFFASISAFQTLFSPLNDPNEVVIDFRNARVTDHSALVAIDALAIRYQSLGKKLHLKHLSQGCGELLNNAKGMIEVNVLEDPKYHIADNKLG
jgi:SulP family sulfate permease